MTNVSYLDINLGRDGSAKMQRNKMQLRIIGGKAGVLHVQYSLFYLEGDLLAKSTYGTDFTSTKRYILYIFNEVYTGYTLLQYLPLQHGV